MKIQPIRISLSDSERKRVRDYGIAVYKNKITKDTNVDAVDKKRKTVILNVVAAASEFAVCKYFGIEYDFKLYDVRDQGDLVIKGLNADVKCGKAGNDLLKVMKYRFDNHPKDIYISVNQDVPNSLESFTIYGWLFYDEFKDRMRLKTFTGYEDRPMYVVSHDRLEDIALLSFFKEI